MLVFMGYRFFASQWASGGEHLLVLQKIYQPGYGGLPSFSNPASLISMKVDQMLECIPRI